ncbi:hypothetical protein SSTU70S_07075 [Stutzerimonas stutzeri]
MGSLRGFPFGPEEVGVPIGLYEGTFARSRDIRAIALDLFKPDRGTRNKNPAVPQVLAALHHIALGCFEVRLFDKAFNRECVV